MIGEVLLAAVHARRLRRPRRAGQYARAPLRRPQRALRPGGGMSCRSTLATKTPVAFRLDGKRALVTGAGRGIGLAAAAALADAGAHVTLAARTAKEIEEAAEAIRARGQKAERADARRAPMSRRCRRHRQGQRRSTSWSTMPAPTGPKPLMDVTHRGLRLPSWG